jgi:hypothetical protein
VEKNAAYVFAKITAKPAAGVDNHRFVRILTAQRPRCRRHRRAPRKSVPPRSAPPARAAASHEIR